MATVFKCDRCGKIVNVKTEMFNFHVSVSGFLYSKNYDICKNCHNDFIKFMNNSEVNNENN